MIQITGSNFLTQLSVDVDNYLYASVCHTSSGDPSMEVRKYNSSGTELQRIGTGVLNGPRGIYVDAQKRVYVADAVNERVVRFLADGNLDNAFSGDGKLGGVDGSALDQFNSPYDVLVDEANQ